MLASWCFLGSEVGEDGVVLSSAIHNDSLNPVILSYSKGLTTWEYSNKQTGKMPANVLTSPCIVENA